MKIRHTNRLRGNPSKIEVITEDGSLLATISGPMSLFAAGAFALAMEEIPVPGESRPMKKALEMMGVEAGIMDRTGTISTEELKEFKAEVDEIMEK